MEFRDYFRHVVDYVRQFPLEKVLENPDVKERCQRVLQEQDEFKTILKKHSHQEGTVVVTDFRETRTLPAGNRFLVYTLYPAANVEVRLFPGVLDNTVVAVGHSIFNRTCKVNVGQLMVKYGGGGHFGAGTCQIPTDVADTKIAEIIKELGKK
jgi:nanoRNase/pAp phosphatase (c-di-AMP/oligoRNAs hydrolase)